jgi:Family of unknown function (DUF6365)
MERVFLDHGSNSLQARAIAAMLKRHLILALNNKGFGESVLGFKLALELQHAGDEVLFLTHNSNLKLFGTRFPYVAFSDAAAPLFRIYFDDCLERFHPSSIILSDFATTLTFFQSLGWTLEMVTAFDGPVFAIDTWGLFRVPENDSPPRDGSHSSKLAQSGRAAWGERFGMVSPLCPVPFLAQGTVPGLYCSLPSTISPDRRIAQRISDSLGLDLASKVVLFCTSPWQHSAEWQEPTVVRDHMLTRASRAEQMNPAPDDDWADAGTQWSGAKRLASSLPGLLADYLSRLGKSVHLLHIGPRPFEIREQLQGRYHWLSSLSHDKFEALLARADLLLSANITGTTIAKAMALRVPVVVMHNSISAASVEEAESGMGKPLSPALQTWLKNTVPLSPFSLWPLGYWHFLEPILQNNPYTAALQRVEILDQERVESTLESLLFNVCAREDQIHRQACYANQVCSLPSGVELIKAKFQS